MHIQVERGEGIIAYNVMNLTPSEMRTIVDMDKKIADILISHHPESKDKKQYLSDDDLFKLRGILWAFARKSHCVDDCNAFNNFERELREEFEQSHCSDATSTDE